MEVTIVFSFLFTKCRAGLDFRPSGIDRIVAIGRFQRKVVARERKDILIEITRAHEFFKIKMCTEKSFIINTEIIVHFDFMVTLNV